MGYQPSERTAANAATPRGTCSQRPCVFYYFAGEVYEGIYCSNDPEGNEKALAEFLHDVTVLVIDEGTSRLFGKERGRLRAQGKRVSDFDLMIGVTALQHGLTLLTNNRKHFEDIGGLQVESLL